MSLRGAAELALTVVCAASCAAPNPSGSIDADTLPLATMSIAPQSMQTYGSLPFEPPVVPKWAIGQPLYQGFFGASLYDHVAVNGSSSGTIDGDEGDLDQLPVLGGGAQWKLAGDRMSLGLEGMFSFSGRADAEAFAFGGGGAVVVIDVDLLLYDFYGGPFVSIDIGDRVRIYGAAGPVMQFADWDQTIDDVYQDGDGFGTGVYTRAGIEFLLPSGTYIGFGARWSDTTVDLSNGLGDLEMEGVQIVFTVTRAE